MTEPKVSERMRSMVREMLKEIRHDSRFNVMDYDSVDHLLSAIAELEERAEKWKEAAVSCYRFGPPVCHSWSVSLAARESRYNVAIAALGPLWDEAVK